jgi:tRNA pseudouridine38-40 synthase
MPTFKAILEYDGTHYAGWQRQPHRPTVQAAVEEVLSLVARQRISVVGAGRTDAGVHALGQAASFHAHADLTAGDWLRALNGLLPKDIAVRSVEQTTDTFHARYAARAKLYEYRILNRLARPALNRFRVWHIRTPLDVPAMREAAAQCIGCRDFSSFENSPTANRNSFCHVQRLTLHQELELIRIEIYADRFLRQMVRALVGTLVEVGRGVRKPDDMQAVLEARSRSAAGKTAPPYGLYLIRVDF